MENRDTVSDPALQVCRIADHLKFPTDGHMIESIVNLEKQCRKSGNLEFNEGKLTRYLREMTDEEVERCNQRLGPLIERMGFEIEASC